MPYTYDEVSGVVDNTVDLMLGVHFDDEPDIRFVKNNADKIKIVKASMRAAIMEQSPSLRDLAISNMQKLSLSEKAQTYFGLMLSGMIAEYAKSKG